MRPVCVYRFRFSFSLFLAALLDSLSTGVQRSLSACLSSQLLARLLLCWRDSCQSLLRDQIGLDLEGRQDYLPALFFSMKAKSSSSSSLFCFLAAFRGLALPPMFCVSEDVPGRHR